jgi:hypothetical protein
MSAQVRDGVPGCHVAQLDRLESCPDRPSRREDLSPVPARLKQVQIARFRDMPVPPHDDAVAARAAAPLQMHFGDLAGGHADPEVVVTLGCRGFNKRRELLLGNDLVYLPPDSGR